MAEAMDEGVLEQDWQSGKTVLQSNRYMWANKLGCDVTFLVGDQARERISAHKYVLSSRSAVFYAMFDGPLQAAAGDEIFIPDVTPDAFNALMLYLYCEEARLNLDNVLEILYAANKYCVKGLSDRCLNKLKSNMVATNVCTVMENAHLLDHADLRKRCLTVIMRDPQAVFNSEAFPEICSDCLELIIKDDNLSLDESDIFRAVANYANKRCAYLNLENTVENRRQVLGNVLMQVRFPVLGLEFIENEVEPSGLLTQNQCVVIFRYLAGNRRGDCGDFIVHQRKKRFCVERFTELASGWGYQREKADAIYFECSENILVYGIQMYGSHQGPAAYEVFMKLTQDYDAVKANKRALIDTDGAQKVYNFLFDKPVPVDKNKQHGFIVVFKGPPTYYGEKGNANITNGGNVTFKFLQNKNSTNNTNPLRGQIPGIIYELRTE